MRNIDHPRIRVCDPSSALPGWHLSCVADVQARPNERYLRSNHPYHTIECVVSGRGRVQVGDQERMCSAGDSYWLPLGANHDIEADSDEPWRKLYCNLHGALIPHLAQGYGLTTQVFPRCDIHADLMRLLDHHGSDHALQVIAGQVIHGIIAAWYASTATESTIPTLVTTAKNFIDRHLEQPLTLTAIAQHAACSPSHLVRLFSKHLGIAPAAYLLKQRMQLAATILATTSEPIKAIAARLHYSDAFAFSHAFSQAMDISPSHWRQRHGGS